MSELIQPGSHRRQSSLSATNPGALTLDLEHLSTDDVQKSAAFLRSAAKGAHSRQAVACRIADHFYESLRIPATGERACVLVRCFQTCRYARLPLDYQDAADRLLERASYFPDLRCLALLATRGDRLIWNDAVTSANHQAIPLPSVEVVQRAPMIARLLDELGLPIEKVVAPPSEAGFLLSEDLQTFNVFHVSQALGSPFIPAQQEFVEPFGVQSVIGMGGLLPEGELFVVLVFTRVPISREVASLFGTLAESVKLALLPFPAGKVFLGPEE